MLAVADNVLHEIERSIGAHPPERGGALLGPVGRPFITRFVFDPGAQTTSASYRPSRALNRQVKETESTEALELKGIVHSHPGGFDRPSGQDEYEVGVGLGLNPHLGDYYLPIVTRRPAADLAPHELTIGRGKISFFRGTRTRDDSIRIRPQPVREVPLLRDLAQLGGFLGGAHRPDVFLADVGLAQMLGGRIEIDGGMELLLLASELYPAVAPLLLVTPDGGDTEQVTLRWALDLPAEGRLIAALDGVFSPPGPYRIAYGPAGGPALTRDPERAQRAGWSPRFTGADPTVAATGLRDELFARSQGLLARDVAQKRVLLVGAGSVGSYVAEQLCRSGVGSFSLVDMEQVEPANLCRTAYAVDDVGAPKVEALGRRLINLNPLVQVETRSASLLDLETREVADLVSGADLVVAATDDAAAQRALDRFAYALHRPALFVGLYAGAQGGEVVAVVPERTPCYLCATSVRHAVEEGSEQVSGTVDYGTGRLTGEVALGADIHHVASAAVKLGLAMLLPEDSSASLKGFLDGALAGQLTYLTLSMAPEYWFYPSVFGETPGQYAYQGVWLTPTRRPDCPVCGIPGQRSDPLAVPLRSPRVAGLSIPRPEIDPVPAVNGDGDAKTEPRTIAVATEGAVS